MATDAIHEHSIMMMWEILSEVVLSKDLYSGNSNVSQTSGAKHYRQREQTAKQRPLDKKVTHKKNGVAEPQGAWMVRCGSERQPGAQIDSFL